ncbi:hypothetical protein F2Q69_00034821, partial [Brassica cretica]
LQKIVRRKLLSRSHRNITAKKDIAAIKIQAYYRDHLWCREGEHSKSCVKLQAVAKGVVVRRQARIASHYMHALARLQVTVRVSPINSHELTLKFAIVSSTSPVLVTST